ncbi:FKBP-type peptidyl-prolyl cis-trans isomerase [Luteolibacter marinus]|uniref:FKBP-type peptidyl-prolyl cis-trans isomerase n=1 Tax=Luteolibacter marinus TaxID=2776705 RepID=UPI0018661F17|nr:FKBP-type peptidyl-prolyl cis-trans isomerase [Luteolibacter marinus]
MKATRPILAFAAALGLAACDSKSGEAGTEAKENSAAPSTETTAATTDDAAGEALPGKSKEREAVEETGVKTTASGLKYSVLKSGDGTVNPKATDTVTVHYHGTLLDGTVFDSSVDRGQPASFPLNRVIAGWTEGVQLMRVGDKFRFEIPADLAYGAAGRPPVIPPNSPLVFEVELLEIK